MVTVGSSTTEGDTRLWLQNARGSSSIVGKLHIYLVDEEPIAIRKTGPALSRCRMLFVNLIYSIL